MGSRMTGVHRSPMQLSVERSPLPCLYCPRRMSEFDNSEEKRAMPGLLGSLDRRWNDEPLIIAFVRYI
jgi:hypothetical protein